MAGVDVVCAGAAVEAGVWLLCAVTTSTLAVVSLTVTVSLCCVREVELVGVAVDCAGALALFSTPHAANIATSAMKKAAHKKRFNAKTPP